MLLVFVGPDVFGVFIAGYPDCDDIRVRIFLCHVRCDGIKRGAKGGRIRDIPDQFNGAKHKNDSRNIHVGQGGCAQGGGLCCHALNRAIDAGETIKRPIPVKSKTVAPEQDCRLVAQCFGAGRAAGWREF